MLSVARGQLEGHLMCRTGEFWPPRSAALDAAHVLGKGGELVGTVGCEHTRARLPFCSQNAKRDEKAMAMSHGAAALAGGERER